MHFCILCSLSEITKQESVRELTKKLIMPPVSINESLFNSMKVDYKPTCFHAASRYCLFTELFYLITIVLLCSCIFISNKQRLTLFILTQRPWLLQYSSPVVRMHVPFFGSMLYLYAFLLWGVGCGLSKTEMTVFPTVEPPAEAPEEAAAELEDESLQIL